MTEQISFQTYGGGPAANYERYFVPAVSAPLAEELVELAELRPGERVLDVACGTGVVARLAAARVGASAVVGVDANPGMLAVARAAAGDEPIEWVQAGADSLPLEDAAFDVVLCQMGLQFISDRQGALREMRRVLQPGGRLFVTVPGPTPTPLAALEGALGRQLGPEAAAFVAAVFALHEPADLRALLESAGFPEPQARSERKSLTVPDAKDFLWQYVFSTPLAETAESLDDERRAALQQEFVAGAEPFATTDGLELEVDLTIATARRD